MYIRASLLALLIFASADAQAGVWQSCKTAFANLMPGKYKILTEEEAALFTKTFGGDNPAIPSIDLVERIDPELFWHMVARMPESVRTRILALPSDPQEAWAILQGMEREAELGSRTLLDSIGRAWERGTLGPRGNSPREWLERGLSEYRESLANNPSLRSKLDVRMDFAARKQRALKLWNTDSGVVRVPVVTEGKKTFLKIGDVNYKAVKKGDGWIVYVPKQAVAHPAWNPLDTKKLISMAQQGKKPPKVYQTMLGHDGRFYLLDGNHRFNVDTRKLIPVRIPDPPSTGSIPLFLDVVHVGHPSNDLIFEFMEGRIPLTELLGEKTLDQHFLLRPGSR